MQSLIERNGGVATVVASMREVPLEDNRPAMHFAEELLAKRIDVVVFLTGVGARILLQAVESRHERDQFLRALDQTVTIVRGPKPFAVLREWNVHIDHRAPEPNTWRELTATIESGVPISGKRVAVQEYGKSNEELYDELDRLGANVLRVPVYQWALPTDTAPLEDAIRQIVSGKHDLLLFTSAQQIHNVLEVAEKLGLRGEWLAAASKCVIGSIGPTASETLHEVGLPVDIEASPPKMGQLVRDALAAAPEILAAKLR
ncbi:MAG: uroporphyrinogen-III synthase [Planctomycetaceae bacterium]